MRNLLAPNYRRSATLIKAVGSIVRRGWDAEEKPPHSIRERRLKCSGFRYGPRGGLFHGVAAREVVGVERLAARTEARHWTGGFRERRAHDQRAARSLARSAARVLADPHHVARDETRLGSRAGELGAIKGAARGGCGRGREGERGACDREGTGVGRKLEYGQWDLLFLRNQKVAKRYLDFELRNATEALYFLTDMPILR